MRNRVTWVSVANIHHSAIGEYWGPITGFLAIRARRRTNAIGPLADLGIGYINAAEALMLFTSEAALRAFFDDLPKRYRPWRIKDGDAVLRATHKAGMGIVLDLKHDTVDPSGVLYTDVTSTPGDYTLSRRRIQVGALFDDAGSLDGIVTLHGVSRNAVSRLAAIAARKNQTLVVQDRIRSASGDRELTSALLARTKLPKSSKA